MQKQKKYEWKDTNLSLFGSDTDKKVKKESAQTEKAWQGAGNKIGLKIWRIVKFKVTDWPQDDYGKFYDGDSYIILNTYKDKDSDEILFDVHFWIGKHSSQDEYGTAAYKTVELDTFLDDKPVQHREVGENESDLFKSYFGRIELLKGGAETGFRHVEPKSYKPRMLQFVGEKKKIAVREMPLKRGNLNSEDVFILDFGLEVFQFNGKDCNKDEKFKATQYIAKLRSERFGKPTIEVLDEDEVPADHPVYLRMKDGESKKRQAPPPPGDRKLFRLSDAQGSMEFTEIASGRTIARSHLDSDDVFILDTSFHCYVWIGKGASIDERRNSMSYAHQYLMGSEHPLIPVSVISERGKSSDNKAFESLLA